MSHVTASTSVSAPPSTSIANSAWPRSSKPLPMRSSTAGVSGAVAAVAGVTARTRRTSAAPQSGRRLDGRQRRDRRGLRAPRCVCQEPGEDGIGVGRRTRLGST